MIMMQATHVHYKTKISITYKAQSFLAWCLILLLMMKLLHTTLINDKVLMGSTMHVILLPHNIGYMSIHWHHA